jgi:hypothetical protein
MDDDSPLRRFFLEPCCPRQRQYEALRAVFVEGLSQKEAAQRFGYSHDAFRQLLGQFRSACAVGTPPPFSTSHAGGGRRSSGRRQGRTSRPAQTHGR